MKIKLSKSQWEAIGNKTGWNKTASDGDGLDFTPTQSDDVAYLSPSDRNESQRLEYEKENRRTEKEENKRAYEEDLYKKNPAVACKSAIAKTRQVPMKDRMEAINKLLHGYGVEAIRGEWQNGYWCDIVATYVNMGDTYDTTVMMVRGKSRMDNAKIIVTSYGDWIEQYGEKYGIQ